MNRDECPAGGEHVFRVHDESPVGPRRVVHCTECSSTPPKDDDWLVDWPDGAVEEELRAQEHHL